MAVLSAADVAALVLSVGWAGEDAVIAVAVCLAESSGDTQALAQEWDGTNSAGLWQINSVHELSDVLRYDARQSTKWAHDLWVGQGWSPWGAWNDRRFLGYMDTARAAVGAPSGSVAGVAPVPAQLVDSGGWSIALEEALARPLAVDLSEVVLRDDKLEASVIDATTSAVLKMSSNLVTQLELEISDPALDLLRGGPFHLGATMRYSDLDLEVATVGTGEGPVGPVLKIVARTLGVQILRRRRGPLTRNQLSPTDWAALEAQIGGLKLVGQPTLARANISMLAAKATGELAESSWDCLTRLAGEEAFLCAEAGGFLYFAQPSWLLGKVGVLALSWPSDNLRSLPACVRSFDTVGSTETAEGAKNTSKRQDPVPIVTVGLEVERALAGVLRPAGTAIELQGVPTFEGVYLVGDVTLDFADPTAPCTVTASTAVDPVRTGKLGPSDKIPEVGDPYGVAQGKSATTGQRLGDTAYIWPVLGFPWPLTACGSFGAVGCGRDHVHEGVDLGVARGTVIVASRAGRVTFAGEAGGYGNAVYIDHGANVETRYGHMLAIAPRTATNPQGAGSGAFDDPNWVAQGEVIGWVDSTGSSTGDHLHFEIRVNGLAVDPVGLLPDPSGP